MKTLIRHITSAAVTPLPKPIPYKPTCPFFPKFLFCPSLRCMYGVSNILGTMPLGEMATFSIWFWKHNPIQDEFVCLHSWGINIYSLQLQPHLTFAILSSCPPPHFNPGMYEWYLQPSRTGLLWVKGGIWIWICRDKKCWLCMWWITNYNSWRNERPYTGWPIKNGTAYIPQYVGCNNCYHCMR